MRGQTGEGGSSFSSFSLFCGTPANWIFCSCVSSEPQSCSVGCVGFSQRLTRTNSRTRKSSLKQHLQPFAFHSDLTRMTSASFRTLVNMDSSPRRGESPSGSTGGWPSRVHNSFLVRLLIASVPRKSELVKEAVSLHWDDKLRILELCYRNAVTPIWFPRCTTAAAPSTRFWRDLSVWLCRVYAHPILGEIVMIEVWLFGLNGVIQVLKPRVFSRFICRFTGSTKRVVVG